MRVLRLVALLGFGAAGVASAQLAAPAPTEKLLLLPLPVAVAGDSTTSVTVMDAARNRVNSMVRYKVYVVPKTKLCEALSASGFPCDVLMPQQQAAQLSKFLGVPSYNIGRLARAGSAITADMRLVSTTGAGFSASFSARGATPEALAESLATRISSVVRAGEYARNCNDQRSRGANDKALQEARKAFQIEPFLSAAWLCVGTVYETMHLPADSLIAAAQRALKGDPGNLDAWYRIATARLQKGDTTGAFDADDSLLVYNPTDRNLAMGLATLLQQHKQFARASGVLARYIAQAPGDQQAKDMRRRICIEGEQWDCVLEILATEFADDTAKLRDTTELKLAMLAAQSRPDTQGFVKYTRVATTKYPREQKFWKELGAAFAMAGQGDSAIAAYKQALAINPSDVNTSLLVAQTIVDRAVWDTSAAAACKGDTSCLGRLRKPFTDKVDAAWSYVTPGLAATDSMVRLAATLVAYSGGSKLAQAGSYERGYAWLDQAMIQLAPKSPADTTGPRQALRVQTGFWYGVASTLSLGPEYGKMVKDKSCDDAKAINERLNRSKQALLMGGRLAPRVAEQMLGILGKYSDQMPKVKQAFKCTSF